MEGSDCVKDRRCFPLPGALPRSHVFSVSIAWLGTVSLHAKLLHRTCGSGHDKSVHTSIRGTVSDRELDGLLQCSNSMIMLQELDELVKIAYNFGKYLPPNLFKTLNDQNLKAMY